MGILNTGGTKALTATTGKTSIIYTTGTPTYITITFNTLGGTPSSIEKQVIAGLGQVTPPSPGPTKTGFALIGWSETSGGTTQATFPVVLSATKTYYAIWEASETVKATFAGLDGPSYPEQSGYSPFYVTSPGTPEKTGYNFDGWSPTLPRTITADQTFTAQWSVKQTTITFDPATGNGATNALATYGLDMPTNGWYIGEFEDPVLVHQMTAPTPPAYYNFNGYEDSLGVSYYNASMQSLRNWDKEASEVTLYMILLPINATATFDVAGGTPTPSSQTGQIPFAVTAPSVTRAGYTLSGWSPPLSSSPSSPTTIMTNTLFTAQWTANTYNITYVLNDSGFSGAYPATLHALTPTSYTTGSTVNLYMSWRSTYSWGGWYDNPSFDGDAITSFVDLDGGDRIFYAKWIPIVSYTITPNKTSVDETVPNNTVTFSVTSQHNTVSTLYWKLTATSGTIGTSDFESLSGPIPMTITNALGSGSFVVTLLEDYTSEANDAFKAELRTGSISGTIVKESVSITINDTSKTKTAKPTISVLYASTSQITFTLINNDTLPATIWYSINSDPITSGGSESSKVSNVQPGVANGQTVAFTGLTEGTTYSLRAVALISSSYNHSDVASVNASTTCPASGTLLSTYCVGYDKYGTYATGTIINGICGTYNDLIESNAEYCGYIVAGIPIVGTGTVTANSVEFTIKNSDEDTAVIYWKIRSTLSSGTVVASGNFQVHYSSYDPVTVGYYNASANTTYYLTDVYATVSDKINSPNAPVISKKTLGELAAKPTINYLYCENTYIFPYPYKLYANITNNDASGGTIRVSTSPGMTPYKTINLGAGGTGTVLVEESITDYDGVTKYVYAVAYIPGKEPSLRDSYNGVLGFCDIVGG